MVEWESPGWDGAILPAIDRSVDRDSDRILATVITVEGNAYRRPGAKMVISPTGAVSGTITAGCLEGEIQELATEVLEADLPRVVTYDLTTDDTWGLGIGCNGIVDILLEPITTRFKPVVAALKTNEPIAILTVIDGPVPFRGAKWVYRDNETHVGVKPDWVTADLVATAENAIDTGQSTVIHSDSEISVFVDGISPRPELVIVGSGNDIQPLIDVATAASIQSHVVGFRSSQTLTDRYPGAASVRSTDPATIDQSIDIDESTYIVLMSHNIVDDEIALDRLLRTTAPYIGLMGPRERFDEIRRRLAREGRPVESAEYDRVYAPVGLDLGGDSPSHIALSIVSEIVACHHNRPANHLRAGSGPIHARPETHDSAEH